MASVDSKANITRFVRTENGGLEMGGILCSLQMLEDGIISDINIRDNSFSGFTALIYQTLCTNGRRGLESMESLLAHKPPALPNLQDRKGWTALHWAADCNDPAKLRLLLDYGADKTIRDHDGYRAVDDAMSKNLTECIEVLKNYTPKPRG